MRSGGDGQGRAGKGRQVGRQADFAEELELISW